MLPILLLLAFIIWVAENISTFYQIWLYPSQVDAWHMVGWGKLGFLVFIAITESGFGHENFG